MTQRLAHHLFLFFRFVFPILLLLALTGCMGMIMETTKGERVTFEINFTEKGNPSKPLDRKIEIIRDRESVRSCKVIGTISFELPEGTEQKRADEFLAEIARKADADGIMNVSKVGWYMRPRGYESAEIPVNPEIVKQNYYPIMEKWSGEVFVWE